MLDADFEFYKVKNFLNRSPRILKEDPIVGVEYLKVINLINGTSNGRWIVREQVYQALK